MGQACLEAELKHAYAKLNRIIKRIQELEAVAEAAETSVRADVNHIAA